MAPVNSESRSSLPAKAEHASKLDTATRRSLTLDPEEEGDEGDPILPTNSTMNSTMVVPVDNEEAQNSALIIESKSKVSLVAQEETKTQLPTDSSKLSLVLEEPTPKILTAEPAAPQEIRKSLVKELTNQEGRKSLTTKPIEDKQDGRKSFADKVTRLSLSTKNHQEPSILVPASKGRSKSGVSLFPSTHASIRDRGSDVDDDMNDLASIMQDGAEYLEEYETGGEQVDYSESVTMTIGGTHRRLIGLEDVGRGLEKPEVLQVEEWMTFEQTGEYLGKRKHFLRIINTMDYNEKLMEVSNFWTVNDVINFYQEFNSNCRQYVWKDILGNTLHHHRSLGENGLQDHSLFTDETGLDHFPTILLYFKDGFEHEPPMHLDISKPVPNIFNAPCRNY